MNKIGYIFVFFIFVWIPLSFSNEGEESGETFTTLSYQTKNGLAGQVFGEILTIGPVSTFPVGKDGLSKLALLNTYGGAYINTGYSYDCQWAGSRSLPVGLYFLCVENQSLVDPGKVVFNLQTQSGQNPMTNVAAVIFEEVPGVVDSEVCEDEE